MLEIFKTQDDKTLKALSLNDAESGSWFNMINPSFEEIQKVSLVLDLDESFLKNSLDMDERSRIEFEDGNLLVLHPCNLNVFRHKKQDQFYAEHSVPCGKVLFKIFEYNQ